MKSMLRTEFVVVGAGPVGLAAAMLLEKYKIAHVVLQQKPTLAISPAGGWISMRTKEIFAEVPGLNQRIQAEAENLSHHTEYLHVERIMGKEFGRQRNFYPSVQDKLKQLRNFSNHKPSLLNQSRLCQIMLECMKLDNVQLNTKVISVVENQSDMVVLHALKNNKQQMRVQTKYVLACDSTDSIVRNSLKLKMEEQPMDIRFVSIEFTSQKLMKLITQFNQLGMLHFIYNEQFPSILNTCSYKQGRFVLHVPDYESLNLINSHTPEQLVLQSIQVEFANQVHDLKIEGTHKWHMTGQIAEQFSKGDIFLAGDAAHSLPDLTGMGMNVGIQDVHNLIHKLNTIRVNHEMQVNKSIAEMELLRYASERKAVAKQFLQAARKGYKVCQDIAAHMGFKQGGSTLTNLLSFMPFKKQLVQAAMKNQYDPKPIPPEKQIPFFLTKEYECERLSKYRSQMTEEHNANPHLCYFLDSKAKRQDYPELVGVQDDAIALMEMVDEKLVRSDGVVLY